MTSQNTTAANLRGTIPTKTKEAREAEEAARKAAAKAEREAAQAERKAEREAERARAKAKREQDQAERKAAREAREAETHDCACGCGGQTKSTFVPGHDAKLKSAILAEQRWLAVRAMLETADPDAVAEIREQLGIAAPETAEPETEPETEQQAETAETVAA